MSLVLVSGGSGFIGTNLRDYLYNISANGKANYDVLVLDKTRPAQVFEREYFEQCDITNSGSVSHIIREYNPDFVVHLAALITVPESYREPAKYFSINCLGTLNILEALRTADTKLLVFMSSASVYGNAQGGISETNPPKPSSMYGLTKLMGELLLERYREDYGINTLAFRLFNAYGPYQPPDSGVIPIFINRCLQNLPIVLYNNGKNVRDFVYVGDVVRVLTRTFDSYKKISHRIMNLGTGIGTSIKDLARMIVNLTGSKSEIVQKAEQRDGDIIESVADNTLLTTQFPDLAFTPLEEGLSRTIEYFKK